MILIFWMLIGFLTILALGCLTTPYWLKPVVGVREHPWFLSLLLFSLPLLALILYLNWGSSQSLMQYFEKQHQIKLMDQYRSELGTPKEVIERLKEHLAHDANSAKGWYLLGRLYFSQQQFVDASFAFKKALSLKSNDKDVLVLYAQSLYLTDIPHSMSQGLKIANDVLSSDANNAVALNLLAVNAYSTHQYKNAITYWERLLKLYSEDAPDAIVIKEAIARAQTNEIKGSDS